MSNVALSLAEIAKIIEGAGCPALVALAAAEALLEHHTVVRKHPFGGDTLHLRTFDGRS